MIPCQGCLLSQLKTTSSDCLRVLNYMYCWPCSPDSQYFYDLKRRQMAVCRSMCDAIYDFCGSADWKGATLRDSFSSGTQMCTQQGYQIVDDTTSGGSEDSSSATTPGQEFGCFGIRPGDSVLPHRPDGPSSSSIPVATCKLWSTLSMVSAAAGLIAVGGSRGGGGAQGASVSTPVTLVTLSTLLVLLRAPTISAEQPVQAAYETKQIDAAGLSTEGNGGR